MATVPTNPEANQIATGQMTEVQAREVEFAQMFVEDIKKLLEVLGQTEPIAQAAGTELVTYEATGTLQDGSSVGEGEVIPLSQYELEKRVYKTATFRKWRKSTTAEAILSSGYDKAVTKTTDKMRSQAQKEVKKDFFDFLQTGTGRASAASLQAGLAAAWGQLEVFFEDYGDVEPVYFVNPLDIATYLGSAQITTQEAFGMKYIEDFLGLGTVITNSNVPQGTIAATAKANIKCVYVPLNGSDLGEAFAFTTDETGYVGIHEMPNYENLTAQDVVVCGLDFFPEFLDGVILATVESGKSIAEHKYTQAELEQMTKTEILALAAKKSYTITATIKAAIISEFLTAQG